MKYTTTKEIMFDLNNLPADISEVEWCTRAEHETAMKERVVTILGAAKKRLLAKDQCADFSAIDALLNEADTISQYEKAVEALQIAKYHFQSTIDAAKMKPETHCQSCVKNAENWIKEYGSIK